MKLFFEAGTVGAADEASRGDAYPRAPRRVVARPADVAPAPSAASTSTAATMQSGRAAPPAAAMQTAAGMQAAAAVQIVNVPAVPVKPIILEWDEWTLAVQHEPVIFDAPEILAVPEDAPTTPDLLPSAVHTLPDLTAHKAVAALEASAHKAGAAPQAAPEVTAEKPQGKPARSPKQQHRSHERLRGPDRSFIDGTKRTL